MKHNGVNFVSKLLNDSHYKKTQEKRKPFLSFLFFYIPYLLCNKNLKQKGDVKMSREERLKEIEREYEAFIQTEAGVAWINGYKTRNNEQGGDCGDYIYDFYPELLI